MVSRRSGVCGLHEARVDLKVRETWVRSSQSLELWSLGSWLAWRLVKPWLRLQQGTARKASCGGAWIGQDLVVEFEPSRASSCSSQEPGLRRAWGRVEPRAGAGAWGRVEPGRARSLGRVELGAKARAESSQESRGRTPGPGGLGGLVSSRLVSSHLA